MAELRKYGVAVTMLFPLIARGVTDLYTGAVFAAGDLQISKDEGAFVNTNTATPTHEGNGMHSIALTATEMQAARIMLTMIDQTDPKVFEDQMFLVDTYGDASAQHAFDLDASLEELADEILKRPISNVEPGAVFRTLYGAIAGLVNRRRIAGGVLQVYKTDDVTELESLAVTTDASQDPVSELNP